MDVQEAKATLDRHGFVRGKHNTMEIRDEPRRSEIKAALRALFEDELARVAPKTATPAEVVDLHSVDQLASRVLEPSVDSKAE